jgi:hypothetical protein
LEGWGSAIELRPRPAPRYLGKRQRSYAGSHPDSELAKTLQWVGVGILFLGIAIVLLAWGVLRRSD